MKEEEIVHWAANIKTSIINDVRDVAIYHSVCDEKKIKSAGFFSIPRQVFCYIDYLGLIAYHDKKKNTENAVRFIKEFFPSNYKNYAELLYSMWRHGTVHQYAPKAFHTFSKDGKERMVSIGWFADNSNSSHRRKEHLKIYISEGNKKRASMIMNNCQLVDDLLAALNNFVKKLKADKAYANKCFGSILVNTDGTVDYKEIENNKVREIVREQIQLALNNIVGEVDEKGNIIKRYDTTERSE